MSTSYYRIQPPVTHLSVEDAGQYDKLTMITDHEAITLLVDKGYTKTLVRQFALYERDVNCPLRTHWGGSERGTIVTVNDASLPDDTWVISSYGDLLTVGAVKARAGARRKDGLPTELMGYEETDDD